MLYVSTLRDVMLHPAGFRSNLLRSVAGGICGNSAIWCDASTYAAGACVRVNITKYQHFSGFFDGLPGCVQVFRVIGVLVFSCSWQV